MTRSENGAPISCWITETVDITGCARCCMRSWISTTLAGRIDSPMKNSVTVVKNITQSMRIMVASLPVLGVGYWVLEPNKVEIRPVFAGPNTQHPTPNTELHVNREHLLDHEAA